MVQTDTEQRENLRKILFELSESQKVLEDKKERAKIFLRLEKVYLNEGQEFRHFYSDIFSWLTQIDMDKSNRSIDVLAQNLEVLRKGYRPLNTDTTTKETIDISRNLNKLYDHVNLDVSRINYLKSVNCQIQIAGQIDKLLAKAEKLEHDTQELKEQTDTIQKSANEAEESVKGAQRESTAILGIFAAIVLAFTGGMIFSTSVFENIGNASIYKIGILSLLVAFTLLNIIFFLLKFIMVIVRVDKIEINIVAINVSLFVMALVVILAWLVDLPQIAELFRGYISAKLF